MNFINKVMRAHYSLPTFVWVAVSLILAGIVAQIAYSNTANAFVAALPFDGKVWSTLLAISSLSAIIGMIKDTKRMWFVRTGAFVSFCLWIFGTISFVSSGAVFIFLLSAPLLIVFAYVYLASLQRKQQL